MGWLSWFPRRKELVVGGGPWKLQLTATTRPLSGPLELETRRRFSGKNRVHSRLNTVTTHGTQKTPRLKILGGRETPPIGKNCPMRRHAKACRLPVALAADIARGTSIQFHRQNRQASSRRDGGDAISDGRCREEGRSVSSFALASRLRVVMVEVRGRARFPKFHQWPSVCVQPWHDALLKIGNALIMMFWWVIRARQFDPEPFPHASSPHHLSLWSGSWGLGPRWRSFNPLGIAAISRNAPKKQLLMVTIDSVKNRMVSSIGGSRRIYPHCLVCGTRRGDGHGAPLASGVRSLFSRRHGPPLPSTSSLTSKASMFEEFTFPLSRHCPECRPPSHD